jgi:hypothetical protein
MGIALCFLNERGILSLDFKISMNGLGKLDSDRTEGNGISSMLKIL